MNGPLVSVLIPAFNSENFICQCIESVLDQDYAPVEIIVVDDGSTDKTSVKLCGYTGIKVLSQANQGACEARNKAIHAASGKYIKFLDADDYLLAGALAAQVELMETLDSRSIVYGDYSILREGVIKAVSNSVIDHESDQLAQLVMANILTSTPMHRKGLLVGIGGFDARFKSGQEWNLHVRLAAAGVKFVYSPGAVYVHRVHFSENRISIKRKNSPSRLQAELDKLLMTLHSVDNQLSETSLAAFSACVWGIGRAAWREGKQDLANACFDLAQKTSPQQMTLFWPRLYKINYSLFGISAAEKISQLSMRFKKSLFY